MKRKWILSQHSTMAQGVCKQPYCCHRDWSMVHLTVLQNNAAIQLPLPLPPQQVVGGWMSHQFISPYPHLSHKIHSRSFYFSIPNQPFRNNLFDSSLRSFFNPSRCTNPSPSLQFSSAQPQQADATPPGAPALPTSLDLSSPQPKS
jgi:hypothetical protein